MSYHILHLLSHNLRVRLELDQLRIKDRESGVEKSVPLADVAIIIAATPDLSLTAGALRRMAELNVLMLICNEKFEPCCLNLPYYRATSTALLRRQVDWTAEWKEKMWRQVIVAKIRNQAANLAHLKRAHSVLTEIAERCLGSARASRAADGASPSESSAQNVPDEGVGNNTRGACAPRKISLATITGSRRAFFLSNDASACESRAARHYWKHLLPRLSEDEKRREPGTRQGVNGMLDYGYAILRTAVLRSLAAHGFIAALGIHHAPTAGSFALADDLMEPLRPWMDRELRLFIQGGEIEMEAWIPRAAALLTLEVPMGQTRVRLINAIDLYVQSFADATLAHARLPLRIPMLG